MLQHVLQAFRRLPGHRLLATMPKNVDLTERRDARSAKTKKLKSYGPPSQVKLQVLGTGAEGAPRALYVFTTTASYLFNCGEGTQRLSHERKTRLARLENVFVTCNSWRNVGGVLGALLTLNDIGVPALTLHGPPGLSSLYDDTRSFIQLRGMNVQHRSDTDSDFVDVGLKVRAVPLYGSEVRRDPPPASESPPRPSVDYFAYERTGGRTTPTTPPTAAKSQRAPQFATAAPRSNEGAPRSHGEGPAASEGSVDRREVAYAYVCTVPDWPGRLSLEKCVNLGVKPGPLLGRLKAGHNVVLEDGTVVRSADVTSPDELGPQFVVLELPSADFLPSLSDLDSSIDMSRLTAVVHFSPPAVMDESMFRTWRGGLPATVRHIVLNEESHGHGSEAVHRLQHQLNTIDSDLFPLLTGDEVNFGIIPANGGTGASNGTGNGDASEPPTEPTEPQPDSKGAGERKETEGEPGTLLHPPSGWGLSLRPAAPPDTEGVLPVTPEVYRAELAADETFVARLDEYRRARSALPPSDDVYPQTVFLGTGSSIPNKKRNTSGILVNLSEKHSILLDCGEGTHGQLVRLQGSECAAETLRRLSAIYISHLHADHHIGLISILEARRRALGADHKPCLLMAPAPITNYLNMYHTKMAPLRDTFTLVHNAGLLSSRSPPPDWITRRLTEAGLTEFTTCLVRHCPLAYGVRLAHTEGQEVVYSGDTRPCDELVELGRGCDLLIHEATHEDELQEEAVLRAHSTVSEAIEVGVRMGARHVLLTHFSQRYASLPMLPEPAPNNVGIAYDNMVINHGHLPRVPLLYPALRRAFAESYDQCVERTAKRRDRKLREAEVLAEAERTA
ncbi:ribonuclease Z, mitochondrial-like isoform X2 [Amphibalanus amphitrite]|uniref:ribonuclease Z, mitochondrial-like isoform X2 n=2 Tax=Amphibalanus amphitrite TaxID=1232801 RepID=UPI001C918DAF|nr:ribonuclease Z, mitochondrial-like isoform X2 [Amphibalanus amphitrite]